LSLSSRSSSRAPRLSPTTQLQAPSSSTVHTAQDIRPVSKMGIKGIRVKDAIYRATQETLTDDERRATLLSIIAIYLKTRMGYENTIVLVWLYGGVAYRKRALLKRDPDRADPKQGLLNPDDLAWLGGPGAIAAAIPHFPFDESVLIKMISAGTKITSFCSDFVRAYIKKAKQDALLPAQTRNCTVCRRSQPAGHALLDQKCVTCHFFLAAATEAQMAHFTNKMTKEELIKAIRQDAELAHGQEMKYGPSTECARRLGIDLDWIRSVTPCGNPECIHALQGDNTFLPGLFNLQQMEVLSNTTTRIDNLLECTKCRLSENRGAMVKRHNCRGCGTPLYRVYRFRSTKPGTLPLGPLQQYDYIDKNGTVFNFCAICQKEHCSFAVTPTADAICKEVGPLALNKLELEAERVATIISYRAAEPLQDDTLPDLRELRNVVWNRLLSAAVNAEADQQLRALLGDLQEQTAADATQASGRKDLAEFLGLSLEN
ncbi:hypothetical protein A4X13_0g9114, partial [Tilletia indica]